MLEKKTTKSFCRDSTASRLVTRAQRVLLGMALASLLLLTSCAAKAPEVRLDHVITVKINVPEDLRLEPELPVPPEDISDDSVARFIIAWFEYGMHQADRARALLRLIDESK